MYWGSGNPVPVPTMEKFRFRFRIQMGNCIQTLFKTVEKKIFFETKSCLFTVKSKKLRFRFRFHNTDQYSGVVYLRLQLPCFRSHRRVLPML
jgi:hypothetical protein